MSNRRLQILNGLALTYAGWLLAALGANMVLGFGKDFVLANMTSVLVAASVTAGLVVGTSVARQSTAALHSARFWLFTFLLSFAVSLVVTQFSIGELIDAQGSRGAARLFSGLAHVNFALLPEALVEVVETIFVAFLATAIAIPLAFLLAFFCARNIMVKPAAFAVYGTLRTFLNLTRSIEPLIWAVIFSVWVGIGPFAGMLALMIHSVASLTKQYSEIIEGVNSGPVEAVRATGANSIQVVWYGIVPQVILPYIAFTFYRWDINVRMATVIGLAGGGGIGTLLLKYQGQAMWNEVGCIILVIALVVWLMDSASAQVREALK